MTSKIPACDTGWTRLKIGDDAQITPGLPNVVRSAPGISSDALTQLLPGTVVKIIEGLICADGYIFWNVENATIPGGSGWTAEGDGVEYWLEPYKQ